MKSLRLKERYLQQVRNSMIEKFAYGNAMQVPKLLKICLNQGLGKAVQDKKIVEYAVQELTLIAGQRAVMTQSRKDISNFKLRKGVPIGAKVTLRGNKMYDFLDRLICIALPRTRDFKGVSSKGFDGKGNYTFGIKEQIIYPEIDIEKVKEITGMDITIVTSAKTDAEAFSLLQLLGIPFEKK